MDAARFAARSRRAALITAISGSLSALGVKPARAKKKKKKAALTCPPPQCPQCPTCPVCPPPPTCTPRAADAPCALNIQCCPNETNRFCAFVSGEETTTCCGGLGALCGNGLEPPFCCNGFVCTNVVSGQTGTCVLA